MHGEQLGARERGAERTARGSPVRGSFALESPSPGEPYAGERFPGLPSPVPGRARIAAGAEKGCARAAARISGVGEPREERSPRHLAHQQSLLREGRHSPFLLARNVFLTPQPPGAQRKPGGLRTLRHNHPEGEERAEKLTLGGTNSEMMVLPAPHFAH